MTDDDTRALISDLAARDEQGPEQPPSDGVPDDLRQEPPSISTPLPERSELERSFASEHLDELILALLLRRDEANGMDIIRTFAHRFGVQFSPGTVYPHLHSLEEEGVLACRECVQTKEYRIVDERAARSRIESTLTQLSALIRFLEPPTGGENSTDL